MMVTRCVPRLLVPALIGTLAVCAGCSPSATQRIAQGYQQKIEGRPTVLVLPLGSELGQHGSSNSKPRKATRKYFYSFFGLALSDQSAVDVLQADPEWMPPGGRSFEHRTVSLNEKQSLAFPVPSGPVAFDGATPDFVLVIDALSFSLKARPVPPQALHGTAGAELMLIGQTNYLLWDNEKQQPVAWGSVQETTRVGKSPSSTDYLAVFRKLANSILAYSPLPRSRS